MMAEAQLLSEGNEGQSNVSSTQKILENHLSRNLKDKLKHSQNTENFLNDIQFVLTCMLFVRYFIII